MSEPKFTQLVASPECADNGALSHYNLCDPETGEKIGIYCDEDAMVSHTGKREEQYVNLFAAAPELLECLREAIEQMCGECPSRRRGVCSQRDGECFVIKWINVDKKARGEE